MVNSVYIYRSYHKIKTGVSLFLENSEYYNTHLPLHLYLIMHHIAIKLL